MQIYNISEGCSCTAAGSRYSALAYGAYFFHSGRMAEVHGLFVFSFNSAGAKK